MCFHFIAFISSRRMHVEALRGWSTEPVIKFGLFKFYGSLAVVNSHGRLWEARCRAIDVYAMYL